MGLVQLMNDKEQTRLLRNQRVEEKRQVKELNNPGKRLGWVREKLELSFKEVSLGTGVPISSLHGREVGLRPELIEEFLVLSNFFNKAWKHKYKDSYPFYCGSEVKKISTQWLMFGHDDVEANSEVIIQEYKIKLKELEEDYWYKEQELRRQLSLFAEDEAI